MRSIKIKVPRDLIKKFFLHPEPYSDGYYVVDLINNMYTDIFYRKEGDFITSTNDNDLISYLKKTKVKPREYFFKSGFYSLRYVQDCDCEIIKEWTKISPISVQLDMPKEHSLPSEFMFCFYWIEVGKATIEESRMTLNVYEKEFIHMINIGAALDLIMEHFNISDSY